MTEEELYAELPDDPELAFLQLEKFYRIECNQEIQLLSARDESPQKSFVTYISRVLAAIKERLVTAFPADTVPNIQDVDYNTYLNFGKDVEHYRTGLQIRLARRNRNYSVRFDPATKVRIRHHLDQIRSIVDKLDITERKREALNDRINDLAKEVDRNRSRFELIRALAIEAAGILGEAGEKAEPARKWLDTIAKLIWGAKEDEQREALPPPPPRKAIGSQQPADDGKTTDNQDDEIPF